MKSVWRRKQINNITFKTDNIIIANDKKQEDLYGCN